MSEHRPSTCAVGTDEDLWADSTAKGTVSGSPNTGHLGSSPGMAAPRTKSRKERPSWSRVCMCLVTRTCVTLCDPMDCNPPGASVHGDSPDKNDGVGCHALLQGIFPIQGSNPDVPHCRWILYHLRHQGSPGAEWYPAMWPLISISTCAFKNHYGNIIYFEG